MTDTTEDLFQLDLAPGSVDGAMADAGAGRPRGTYMVPRDKIRVIDGFNIRNPSDPEYKAHVRSLATSIKTNGYMHDKPLAGYVAKDPETDENVIYLTDGHSRLLGVDLANKEGAEITSLPMVVKPKGTSMEDLTVALHTSNSGKPLTPYELGTLFKRMVGFGRTEKEIATRFGVSKKYVDDLLLLVGANKDVQDLVMSGKVAATLAIETLKVDGAKAGKKLTKAVEKAEAQGKKKITAKALKADKHIDDIMVDDLCKALKARLAEKREAGRGGWEDPDQCSPGRLLAGADKHAKGGMLIDQIAYLAMLRYRGVTGEEIQAMRGEDIV